MTESRQAVMDVIFGEVRLAMDLWRCRPDPDAAAEAAADILAAWGHAHRLDRADDPIWPELDGLVKSQAAALAEAAVAHDGPEAWLRDFDRLLDKAPDAASDGEFEACVDDALELFTRLDQAQLVAWSMSRLGVPGGMDAHARWRPCERAFRKNPLEFFPIAKYAETMFSAYRPDLRGYDADLAAITAKCAVLITANEAWDSDAEPSPEAMRLLRRVFDGWKTSVASTWLDARRKRMEFALAADVGAGDAVLVAEGLDGSWQAHADGAEGGRIVFHVAVDGLPCRKGLFCVGGLEREIVDGFAVFALEDFSAAVRGGDPPALMLERTRKPGRWEMTPS